MNVKNLSHKTLFDAFAVIKKNYSGGDDILREIVWCDDGVIIYDDEKPIGTCLVKYTKPLPIVADCVVDEEYKGTKFAYRLLREMKRLVNGQDYMIAFEGDSYEYLGAFNSVRHIVETKGIGKIKSFDIIRNR